MRKTKKIKKRHRGGAVALCAVLFAVGACSLAAAAVLSARANAAVAHSAELMNALALSDAREELEAANAALGRACAENDTASRAAELAEALDLTARARASLVRAGLGERSGDIFRAIDACRPKIVACLSGEAEHGAAEDAADMLADVIGALENGGAPALLPEAEAEHAGRGYDVFNTAAELTAGALKKRAESYFGEHAATHEVPGVRFPPDMALCGENIFVSLSSARGELLELYFDRPPGEARLGEEKCAAIAGEFFGTEGIPGRPILRNADGLCGAYFFGSDTWQGVVIGIRWDTGRVCYYNVCDHYK